jgi:hypothetical protein
MYIPEQGTEQVPQSWQLVMDFNDAYAALIEGGETFRCNPRDGGELIEDLIRNSQVAFQAIISPAESSRPITPNITTVIVGMEAAIRTSMEMSAQTRWMRPGQKKLIEFSDEDLEGLGVRIINDAMSLGDVNKGETVQSIEKTRRLIVQQWQQALFDSSPEYRAIVRAQRRQRLKGFIGAFLEELGRISPTFY